MAAAPRRSDMEKQLFTLQWHITHRCNLRCAHCYQNDYSAFPDKDELFAVIDDFEKLMEHTGFCGRMNITGGEPMTHPAVFLLLEELNRRSIPFAVLTNGTLIGKREARKLKELGAEYVQVSLDGMKKAHDKIRGEGSFDAAVQGLCRLLREDIDATVSFTAQSGNIKELPKLARFCKDLGVKKLWYDRVVIPAPEDAEKLSLTKEQAQMLMKTGVRLAKNHPVWNQRALQFRYSGDRFVYSCEAGKHLLALLADGTVMPCRRLPVTVGKLPENSLTEIWETSPLLKELREDQIPDDCSGCENAPLCRGGAKCVAFAKTGEWRNRDPDCFL